MDSTLLVGRRYGISFRKTWVSVSNRHRPPPPSSLSHYRVRSVEGSPLTPTRSDCVDDHLPRCRVRCPSPVSWSSQVISEISTLSGPLRTLSTCGYVGLSSPIPSYSTLPESDPFSGLGHPGRRPSAGTKTLAGDCPGRMDVESPSVPDQVEVLETKSGASDFNDVVLSPGLEPLPVRGQVDSFRRYLEDGVGLVEEKSVPLLTPRLEGPSFLSLCENCVSFGPPTRPHFFGLYVSSKEYRYRRLFRDRGIST